MWMPDTNWHNYPEELKNLMLWSEMAKRICQNRKWLSRLGNQSFIYDNRYTVVEHLHCIL